MPEQLETASKFIFESLQPFCVWIGQHFSIYVILHLNYKLFKINLRFNSMHYSAKENKKKESWIYGTAMQLTIWLCRLHPLIDNLWIKIQFTGFRTFKEIWIRTCLDNPKKISNSLGQSLFELNGHWRAVSVGEATTNDKTSFKQYKRSKNLEWTFWMNGIVKKFTGSYCIMSIFLVHQCTTPTHRTEKVKSWHKVADKGHLARTNRTRVSRGCLPQKENK